MLLPEGINLTEGEAKLFVDLVMRLYNQVLGVLANGQLMVPESDDPEAWRSFAAGYLAGAMEDPVWVNNDDHWTFVAWAADLTGQRDLVEPALRKSMDAEADIRADLCRQAGALVWTTYESTASRLGGATTLPAGPPMDHPEFPKIPHGTLVARSGRS